METIKNYLENMFASFPKTAAILKSKDDLYAGMEDKYNELKSLGKSENEAIGIVISEFGNIEELVEELGISNASRAAASNLSIVTMNEATSFVSDNKKYGGLVAIGVWLCIMGGATFLLIGGIVEMAISTGSFNGRENFMKVLALVPLLLLVSVAVSLFIYSGSRLEKYKYLANSFALDYGVEDLIKKQRETYRPTYTLGITIGVILCILSGLCLILITSLNDSDFYGGIALFITLFIVACAVFIFIRVGNVMSAYDQLTKENDYSVSTKAENKIVSITAAIVWPLTTAIYLLWSFLSKDWHITWIIWPVVGILFGTFSAVSHMILENKNK